VCADARGDVFCAQKLLRKGEDERRRRCALASWQAKCAVACGVCTAPMPRAPPVARAGDTARDAAAALRGDDDRGDHGSLSSRINARFRRSLFGAWPASGEVPDAGVLIHCFDSYEDHAAPWRPSGRGDFSGSFVFAAQQKAARAGGGDGRLPLFNSCNNGGIVFAPGRLSCVRCGNGGDAGGHCHRPCAPPREQLAAEAIAGLSYPGDGCTGGSWAPADAGAYLERVTRWQTQWQRLAYNEFIISGAVWEDNLPRAVEAIFNRPSVHAAFLEQHGLDAARHPHLRLDLGNWQSPFSE